MARSKLDHIRARQADAMVLICPFCDIMYESNQKKIEKVAGKRIQVARSVLPPAPWAGHGDGTGRTGNEDEPCEAHGAIEKDQQEGGLR